MFSNFRNSEALQMSDCKAGDAQLAKTYMNIPECKITMESESPLVPCILFVYL